jgi:hypothetical protein
MHLTESTMNSYLERSLEPEALRESDAHVVSCLRCTLNVEVAAGDPARWDRRGILGRLVRVTPTYAQPQPLAWATAA